MKTELMTLNEALERGREFPYSFIMEYSRLYIGKNTEELKPDELTEARFFAYGGELRIYKDEEGFKGFLLTETEEDEFIDKTVKLLHGFGKTLTLRYLLASDEDGQTFIKYTRMVQWKGESENE